MPSLADGAPPGAPDDAGFTIAELLVALSLLAVVLAFASGGIRFGTQAWEATRAVDLGAELGAARSALRACLQAAAPVRSYDGQGRARTEFQGAEARLSLVCPLVPEGGGLQRLDLYLKQTSTRLDLVAATRPYARRANPDDGDAPAEVHRLVEDLEGLSIRYFGDALDGHGVRWQEAWTQPGRLPQLVAVALHFGSNDRRSWPELVVSIKAAGNGAPIQATAP